MWAVTLATLRIVATAGFRHLPAEDLTTPVNGLQVAVDHAGPVFVLDVEV